MAGSSVEPRNAPARCASIGDDTMATANTPIPIARRVLARIRLPDPTIDCRVRLKPDTTVMFFTHLECSRHCGAPVLDPRQRHHLCRCGAPLLARYDLDAARGWSRDSLKDREPNMWRYRELMPIVAGETP